MRDSWTVSSSFGNSFSGIVDSWNTSVSRLQADLFPAMVPRKEPTNGDNSVSGAPSSRLQILRTTRLLFGPGPGSEDEPGSRVRDLLRLCIAPSDDIPCLYQPPKWPMECQVIPGRILHVDNPPKTSEQLYVASGYEPCPQPVGEDEGTVVYQYLPTCAVNYFCRSSWEGRGVQDELVYPALPSPLSKETTLKFDSRFESGNLAKAIRISECFYELHLRSDLYTGRHTQWYYFRVENMRTDLTYRFSIVNLSKKDSLYRHGLRPLMYSVKEAEESGMGWVRTGFNIAYYKNTCYDDDDGEDGGHSYTLTFNVKFDREGDTCYFAHCYPYTYSQLQDFLATIQADPYRSSVCKQRVFCHSQAGNQVYMLTITERWPTMTPEEKKPIILITARVHPGETPSSWIMQGVIDYLTSQEHTAQILREKFIFKIIPMLNPDGVIVGNYRCSLSGKDLNRQYRVVVKDAFPIIWHVKTLIRRLTDDHNATNKLFLYCDIHGHSRKHNYFMYGCGMRPEGDDLSTQVFPLLLSYASPKMFSFESCRFHIRKDKEGTARVVAWNFGVKYSYTLEASLGGTNLDGKVGHHFNTTHYKTMGQHFCDALLQFTDEDPSKERMRARIQARLAQMGSCAEWPASVRIDDLESDDQTEDSGSECGRSTAETSLATTKTISPGRGTTQTSDAIVSKKKEPSNPKSKRKSSQKWKHVQNSQYACSALKQSKASASGKTRGRNEGKTATRKTAPGISVHQSDAQGTFGNIASARKRIGEYYKMAKIRCNDRAESPLLGIPSSAGSSSRRSSNASQNHTRSCLDENVTSSKSRKPKMLLESAVSSFELSSGDPDDSGIGSRSTNADLASLLDGLNLSPVKISSSSSPPTGGGFEDGGVAFRWPPTRRYSSSLLCMENLTSSGAFRMTNKGVYSPPGLRRQDSGSSLSASKSRLMVMRGSSLPPSEQRASAANVDHRSHSATAVARCRKGAVNSTQGANGGVKEGIVENQSTLAVNSSIATQTRDMEYRSDPLTCQKYVNKTGAAEQVDTMMTVHQSHYHAGHHHHHQKHHQHTTTHHHHQQQHVKAAISTTRLVAGLRNRTPHRLAIPHSASAYGRLGDDRSRPNTALSPPPKPEDLLERRGIIPTFLRSPVRNKAGTNLRSSPSGRINKVKTLRVAGVDDGGGLSDDSMSPYGTGGQFFPTLKDALGVDADDNDASSASEAAAGALSACEGVPEAPPPPMKSQNGKKKLLPIRSSGKSNGHHGKSKSSSGGGGAGGSRKKKKHVIKCEVTQVSLTSGGGYSRRQN